MEGVQMSNHIGDTNKMVSETPRMDASAHDDGAIWQTGCDIERELNAANDRIKRLEEAGDALAYNHNPFTFIDWTKAKEDKL
jgi:hypothetical protein